jgi:hypothetical protein
MMGIHAVFPPNEISGSNPISKKKLKQGNGEYARTKTILGFDFGGKQKTIRLEEAKRAYLLTVLKGWICSGQSSTIGIQFKDFEVVLAKNMSCFHCYPGE